MIDAKFGRVASRLWGQPVGSQAIPPGWSLGAAARVEKSE